MDVVRELSHSKQAVCILACRRFNEGLHGRHLLFQGEHVHRFRQDGPDVCQILLSVLRVIEHEIRQGPDVPGRVETGEEGVKMIDFVGVPITVPHDGPHEGIVEIPWNHLKAPLLVLIQVVIVHVVPIVGVEVAHHCVHRKRPKHPVNVQLVSQILRVQIQCFNEVQ